MDTKLNGLKGSLWNPNLNGAGNMPNNIPEIRQKLANFAVIMDMANNARISSLFSGTNARIYQAFLGIDNIISNNCGTLKSSNGQPFAPTWASAYSTWMTNKVATQNQQITSSISAMSAAIPTANVVGQDQQQAASISAQSTFISNFNAAFQVNALTFPAPGSWPSNPLPIQKREACSLSQPSTNSIASVTYSAIQSTSSGSSPPGISTTPSITAPPVVSPAQSPPSSSLSPSPESSSAPQPIASSIQSSTFLSSPTSSALAASKS